MSETSISVRVRFDQIDVAVAIKRLFRQWHNSSASLNEIFAEYEARLPDVSILAQRLNALMQKNTELDESSLKSVHLIFQGNRENVFYYEFSSEPGYDFSATSLLSKEMVEWMAGLEFCSEAVLVYELDGVFFDFFLYEGNEACFHLDTEAEGEKASFEWISALYDDELPGELYDLPVLYKAYNKDLEAAKHVLNGV